MSQQVAPTKGNLLNTKKSLEFATMGFDLLDKKRNILVREMMSLIDRASSIQEKIDSTYAQAYKALQMANVTNGSCQMIAKSIKEDNSVVLTYRSVMGVEIPILSIQKNEDTTPPFDLETTNVMLDNAYKEFSKVKELTVELAEVETSVYKLADAIKKTQKRANALKNVMIPKFQDTIKTISAVLEENSRDTFSTLKLLKKRR